MALSKTIVLARFWARTSEEVSETSQVARSPSDTKNPYVDVASPSDIEGPKALAHLLLSSPLSTDLSQPSAQSVGRYLRGYLTSLYLLYSPGCQILIRAC